MTQGSIILHSILKGSRRLVKQQCLTNYTGLNDLRIVICFRKSEVFVDKSLDSNGIEKLAEHGILCLLCSGTNDVIQMLIQQVRVHIDV